MNETTSKSEKSPSAPVLGGTSGQQAQDNQGTSIGVKLIYVLITGFLSLIPLLGVQGVLEFRDRYAAGIVRTLETSLGGEQQLVGPVVVVPTRWADDETYQPKFDANGNAIERPKPSPFYLVPDTLLVTAELKTERRVNSLYGVIGYASDVEFSSQFIFQTDSEAQYQYEYPDPIVFNWDEAYAMVFMTNTASTKIRPQLGIGDDTIPLSPGIPAISENITPNLSRQIKKVATGYSAPIGRFIQFDNVTSMNTTFQFDGATRFVVSPIGKTTDLKLSSTSTPHVINPFSGEQVIALDKTENVEYSNSWATAGPYREGNAATFYSDLSSPLLAKQNFVAFFDAENIRPYAEIKQALRYGFFLLGFSFLTFFVFDALSQRYLHAAQYFLLGLIQTVFYAVLLAVSEFTGFEAGFFMAAIPTVIVTGLAVASILRSIALGIFAIIIFSAFYSVQYILMDMAQYSLLVAAGAAFIAIAATLLATSRLDWGRFRKTA